MWFVLWLQKEKLIYVVGSENSGYRKEDCGLEKGLKWGGGFQSAGNVLFLDLEAGYMMIFLNIHKLYTSSFCIYTSKQFKKHNKYYQLNFSNKEHRYNFFYLKEIRFLLEPNRWDWPDGWGCAYMQNCNEKAF